MYMYAMTYAVWLTDNHTDLYVHLSQTGDHLRPTVTGHHRPPPHRPCCHGVKGVAQLRQEVRLAFYRAIPSLGNIQAAVENPDNLLLISKFYRFLENSLIEFWVVFAEFESAV